MSEDGISKGFQKIVPGSSIEFCLVSVTLSPENLTILLIRQWTVSDKLYFSGSEIRVALSIGESGQYNGSTIPPGKIAYGEYGLPVASAGLGILCGVGTEMTEDSDFSCAVELLFGLHKTASPHAKISWRT